MADVVSPPNVEVQGRKIFVSSTAEDLSDHRQKVIEGVLRLGQNPIAMEYFGSTPTLSLDECKMRVKEADAVVVIVAHRYGWVPPPEKGGDGVKSITWIEYETAKELDRPIFAFVVDKNAPWPHRRESDRFTDELTARPDLPPEGKQRITDQILRSLEGLECLKNELKQRVRDIFSSPEDLAVKVVASLASWLADRSFRNLKVMLDERGVREAVLPFRLRLEDACDELDRLRNYKEAHDLLHEFEINCYEQIREEAPRFPADERARRNLKNLAGRLDRFVNNLDTVLSREAFRGQDTHWQDDHLRPAAEGLKIALCEKAPKALEEVIWNLERVLALQPSLMNARLQEASRLLRLTSLVDALCRVEKELRTVQGQAEHFGQICCGGVAGLTSLGDIVRGLIAEHDQWQIVDGHLRRIQAQSDAAALRELELTWPTVRQKMQPLIGDRTENWATMLRDLGDRVQTLIEKVEAKKVMDAFAEYRSTAGHRFFEVDAALKRQLEELGKVGDHLKEIRGLLQ